MKGKLVVIEGIDGSGKSTQYSLTSKRLKEDGISFYPTVFPRYDKPSSTLIRMYLDGSFGSDPGAVNPYAASSFYACDRYSSYMDDWGKEYENGTLIFSDRYTTSNAIHQGCKLPQSQQTEFFSWLEDYEYNRLCLPKPDLVFYLDIPLALARSRRHGREQSTGTHADIHERNEEYLNTCLETARSACAFYGWTVISALDDQGREKSVEAINEELYSSLITWLKEQN